MRKVFWLGTAAICAIIGATLFISIRHLSAQGASIPQTAVKLPPGYSIPKSDVPCILPGNRLNLQCIAANDPDAARIRAEEAGLESQALTASQSGTLDPYHQVETLGELEIFDPNLAVHSNLACSFCHDPAAGYANGVSILSVFTGGSSIGSTFITVHGAYPNTRIAKRNPQSYAYAAYNPTLQYLQAQQDFYGGNFWDGRATGYRLQNPAAEQAQDPPVDPEEMANPDTACIVWKLSISKYASFFEQVWGAGSLSSISWPGDVAEICSTPKGADEFGTNTTPVALSTEDRTRANQAFDEFGQAIAAYEYGSEVSPFTSKFDYYLQNKAKLSSDESAGYALFNGKAMCNTCHLDGTANSTATAGTPTDVRPLFTDTTYNNLGLPRNVNLPWYSEDTPDQYGFIGNPLGIGFTDEGIGLFLDGYYGAIPNQSWGNLLSMFEGKFATVTARDAAQVPYSGFVKAYFHNGYITSLKQLVHFYNTRDVYAFAVESGHCPAGTIEKVTCWPMPEDSNNLNMTIGHLGLSDQEENQIVAFLHTLVDGYSPATGTAPPTSQ
jgi:cytochrome c peroxidase